MITRLRSSTGTKTSTNLARHETPTTAMRFQDYEDEFSFVAPLPASNGQRLIPPAGFPTGPGLGDLLPDFELPAADGRTEPRLPRLG